LDIIALHDGRVLHVHEAGQCRLEHCCIHNPSDHPLNTRPLSWSQPIHTMFRVCEHGGMHPDPDDLEYKAATLNFGLLEAITSAHMSHCDGCCQP
jgi:hypothetical protein